MSVKTEHHQSRTGYFCTFTYHRWINLFSVADFYDEIYKWFDIMAALKYQIIGHVIMPNHVHFIIHSQHDKSSLNKRVGTGKRFMAYEIVARLEKLKRQDLLKLLSEGVNASDRRIGKLHHVFIDSFDAREILSEEMMIQKLNYMHHNTVKGKWTLAEDFMLYPHSSAKFYETGVQRVYKVTH